MSPASGFVRLSPTKRPINHISYVTASIKHLYCNTPARHLFDSTSQRDLSSLNSLLTSYIRKDNPLAAWSLFLQMHCTRSDLSAYTFTPVLGACSALPNPYRGQQVHSLIIKLGLYSGTVTKTALINMYSKYGQLDDSVLVFDELGIKDKDVVAWNAMLSGFLRHGFPVKALGVFETMRKGRVKFSEFTLCSVLKACASLSAFQQGKQAHAMVIGMGSDLVVLSTALIDFYSSVGCIDEALKVYHQLSFQEDDVLCNSLISGCVDNREYDTAMSIMRTMRPNVIGLTCALNVCSENSNLWIGKQIHGVVIRQGFVSDTQMCNALLDMYAKCGKILNARVVFDRICHKDVVSWTSMIDAYGSHGRGQAALDLFKKMGEEGCPVLPNSVTLLTVLSACGHSGFVKQGQECFAYFQDRYGESLGPEHYACFIDILGRAGQIEEVWSLFDDMVKNGLQPTSAVWSALLNACRLNQDVKRGEFVAKKLFELEPNTPAYYIALSNFYAAIGRWDSVDMLRGIMKDKGMAKESGSSWVVVANENS